MQKSLTFEEYIKYMDEVAVYRCTFVINKYFNGNVGAFFEAAAKFKEWSAIKSPIQRKAKYASAWAGISHYNFVGIEQKYIKSVFGNNYYDAQFMNRARMELKSMGYEIKPSGMLPYKGKRHYYPAKYLPPQSKLEAIFSDDDEVERILDTSSYCNKVKKILDAIVKENSRKAGKDVDAWEDKTVCKTTDVGFNSWEDLVDEFKSLLNTYKIGSPICLKSALIDILTPWLWTREVEAYWNSKPRSIKDMFAGSWLDYLKPTDKITSITMRLNLLTKIKEQLDGPNASKMFKDEVIKGEFVPADETRIDKARKAVKEKIDLCHRQIKWANEEITKEDVAD